MSDKSGGMTGPSAQLSSSGASFDHSGLSGGSSVGARDGVVKHCAPNSTEPEKSKTGSDGGLKSASNDQPDDVLGHSQHKKKRRKRRRRRNRQVQAETVGVASPAVVVDKSAADVGVVHSQTNNVPPQVLPHQKSVQPQSSEAYAALDLGTNNCRLLVALPTRPGNFRVIDAFSRIVRLGEGLGSSGRLSENAMDRAVEALKICRDKLYARPIQRARLIATEACRSAENGEEFINRVRHETGLKLEVVDRETEAKLAVSGCSSLVDRSAKSIILFDIGGGSSEIALVGVNKHSGGRLSDNIKAWTSLPVGVVTMAEKFGGKDVTPEKFADMVAYATELLQRSDSRELLASAKNGAAGAGDENFHLIGTSGTVTTLAGIHLDLPRYDRRRVDGLWMSSKQVDAINTQLVNWSFQERSANACIGEDRADLVLAGCAILEAIRNFWPSERLRVADRGLREGILTEMMAADGVWRRRNRGHYGNRKQRNAQRRGQ